MSVSSTEPTREGHTFVGWNTEPDGSGTTYTTRRHSHTALDWCDQVVCHVEPVTDTGSSTQTTVPGSSGIGQQLSSTGTSNTTELFILAAAIGAL